MKNAASWTVLSIALALALGAGGCAKKAAQSPPVPPPAPAQPAPTEAPPVPPEPAPTPPVPTTPSGSEIAAQLKPVFFALDSYALSDEARAALDGDAKLLRQSASVNLTIEGHCDERGTSEYNQALGERRAGAARDYLVAAGIDAGRLQVISYGKERPFAEGHDESAWAQNRRAHFVGR